MIVTNAAAMAEARQRPRCEFCGRRLPGGADPAHIHSRGSGGPEAYWNLVSLCRTPCHTASHAGFRPTQADLLAIAAARTGVEPADITAAVDMLRALHKWASPEEIEGAVGRVSAAARRLVLDAIGSRDT